MLNNNKPGTLQESYNVLMGNPKGFQGSLGNPVTYAKYEAWAKAATNPNNSEGGVKITKNEWNLAARDFGWSKAAKRRYKKEYRRGGGPNLRAMTQGLQRRYYIADGKLHTEGEEDSETFDRGYNNPNNAEYRGTNKSALIKSYNDSVLNWRKLALETMYYDPKDGTYWTDHGYNNTGKVKLNDLDWFAGHRDQRMQAELAAYNTMVELSLENLNNKTEKDIIENIIGFRPNKSKKGNYADEKEAIMQEATAFINKGYLSTNPLVKAAADALRLYLDYNRHRYAWIGDLGDLSDPIYKRTTSTYTNPSNRLFSVLFSRNGNKLPYAGKFNKGGEVLLETLLNLVHTPKRYNIKLPDNSIVKGFRYKVKNSDQYYLLDPETNHLYLEDTSNSYRRKGKDFDHSSGQYAAGKYIGTLQPYSYTNLLGTTVSSSFIDKSAGGIAHYLNHDQGYTMLTDSNEQNKSKVPTDSSTVESTDSPTVVKGRRKTPSKPTVKSPEETYEPEEYTPAVHNYENYARVFYGYKTGGNLKMNKLYFQEGGTMASLGANASAQNQQIQEQVAQLVQSAIQGDLKALQAIIQVMQAAESDPQAAEIMNMIAQDPNAQQLAEVLQSMQAQAGQAAQAPMSKNGSKISYLKTLKTGCPDGYEVSYRRQGGHICKECVKKSKKFSIGGTANTTAMDLLKSGAIDQTTYLGFLQKIPLYMQKVKEAQEKYHDHLHHSSNKALEIPAYTQPTYLNIASNKTGGRVKKNQNPSGPIKEVKKETKNWGNSSLKKPNLGNTSKSGFTVGSKPSSTSNVDPGITIGSPTSNIDPGFTAEPKNKEKMIIARECGGKSKKSKKCEIGGILTLENLQKAYKNLSK